VWDCECNVLGFHFFSYSECERVIEGYEFRHGGFISWESRCNHGEGGYRFLCYCAFILWKFLLVKVVRTSD